MFRKPLAAATTALVAAIFTFGAVAAPAFADDGSGATTTDSTTTTTPVADASAAVAVTPATCTAPDLLTLPTPTHATWGTPSLTQGPGDYTVTATAEDGHTFADGQTTDTIKGHLGAAKDCTTQTDTTQTSITTTPAACIDNSLATYTYDSATNSGTFTVPKVPGSSGELCTGVWITAVSWDFTTSDNDWPQTKYQENPANNGQEITASGSYSFSATPRCGQGDVYASWDGASWGGPITWVPDKMYGAHNPVEEHFLHDLATYHFATGPNPTYMIMDRASCYAPAASYMVSDCTVGDSTPSSAAALVFDNTKSTLPITFTVPGASTPITQLVPAGQTATVQVPRVGSSGASYAVFANGEALPSVVIPPVTTCDVTPGDPSAVSAVCSDGASQNGAILVDFQPGVLSYTLIYPDGTKVPVTAASTSVPAGTYTVTVAAEPGYTLTGADQWPLEVTVDPAVDCGDLPTDAVLPTSVTSTAASCSTGLGSITVGPTADYLAFIDYSIDGQKVSGVTTSVKPGTHVVTAAVNQTTAPGDTLDDPGPWTVTIAAASTACGQLKTLALTGTSPVAPLLAAGVLLPAGAALLLGAALIRRRRES